MKAAVVSEPGAAPAYADFADPAPSECRQVLQLVAAGVHPIVRALASGQHYGSGGGWPLVPGVDCVARTEDGTLVYTGGVKAPYGTLAELVSVPTGLAVPLPAGADPALVAGSVNPGLSTWLPLQHLVDRASESLVVITGATGMAGRLGVQNARALGVTQVIALGRDAAQLETLTALGAETTVALTGDRPADVTRVEQVLAGRRPDLVLDLAWGWVAETLFEVLTSRSLAEQTGSTRYVEIGAAAGADAALPGAALRSAPITLVGHGLGSAPMASLGAVLPGYLGLLATGTVRAEVERFPLARVAEAWVPERRGVRHVVTR